MAKANVVVQEMVQDGHYAVACHPYKKNIYIYHQIESQLATLGIMKPRVRGFLFRTFSDRNLPVGSF